MKGMELLGLKVQDKVTKQKGVVTSIAYDLYGCVQATITPESKGGKQEDALYMIWYDIARIDVLSKKPVMELPEFVKKKEVFKLKGPAMKPMKY